MSKTNPTILAIETATSLCSVALLFDGHIYSQNKTGNNIHSQVLLEMIDELLRQAGINRNQIDAIAVDHGPGSFTGLRIGVGVAQGLAFALNCTMIGVSSLEALANQYLEIRLEKKHDLVVVGIDARMSELYWETYTVDVDDKLCSLTQPAVTRPESLQVSAFESEGSATRLIAVGNAWDVYHEKFNDDLLEQLTIKEAVQLPNASSILNIATTKWNQQGYESYVSANDFQPFYVRDNVAKKSNKSFL